MMETTLDTANGRMHLRSVRQRERGLCVVVRTEEVVAVQSKVVRRVDMSATSGVRFERQSERNEPEQTKPASSRVVTTMKKSTTEMSMKENRRYPGHESFTESTA